VLGDDVFAVGDAHALGTGPHGQTATDPVVGHAVVVAIEADTGLLADP